jgi:hypothetical protein
MAATDPLITRPMFEDAVARAIRAPSMYNAQPWRFRLTDAAIEAYVDPAARLPASDPHGWAARIALGAALANVRLAFAVAGYASEVTVHADPTATRAVVRLGGRQPTAPADRALYDAIGHRRSHRSPFWETPVPPRARARLVDAAQHAGAWLELVDDRERVVRVSEIIADADDLLRADANYVVELRRWVGRDEDDVVGIAPAVAGLVPEGQDLLRMRDYGGKTRAPGRDFESEPLLAVLGTVAASPHDDVLAGMALQVVLLTATSDGLATSMLSQPMEVDEARRQLREALRHYGMPHMIVRVGYGDTGTVSPRRAIRDVIDD